MNSLGRPQMSLPSQVNHTYSRVAKNGRGNRDGWKGSVHHQWFADDGKSRARAGSCTWPTRMYVFGVCGVGASKDVTGLRSGKRSVHRFALPSDGKVVYQV